MLMLSNINVNTEKPKEPWRKELLATRTAQKVSTRAAAAYGRQLKSIVKSKWYLTVSTSCLLSVRLCVQKLALIHAIALQNVSNRSCVTCVKSKKYAS